MYCPKCGTQNPDDARFCVSCGNAFQSNNAGGTNNAGQGSNQQQYQNNYNSQQPYQNNYNPQQGYPGGPSQDANVGPIGILFFCIPIAGAIAYFMWKNDKPEKAKKACYIALAGFAVGVVLNIIVTLAQG
jgi:hypothetical protein